MIHYKAMSGLIDNPYIYSTVAVCIVDDNYEVTECIYGNAAKYCNDIAQAILEYNTLDYPTNNLMYYFNLPEDEIVEKNIKQKINSAYLTVEVKGGILYAVLELDMNEDLSIDELEEFINQIDFQYKYGWGAGFELENISTKDCIVCLRVCDAEFYTGNALEETLANQEAGYQQTQTNSLDLL